MPDASTRLSAHLNSDLLRAVGGLLSQQAASVSELRRQVLTYRQALKQANTSGAWPDMDYALAVQCADVCDGLLDTLPKPDEVELQLLHVACRYFVLSDDDEDDFESLVGFDDDALVVNAVSRTLGISELAISLIPR